MSAVESVPTTQVPSLELSWEVLLGKKSVSGQLSPRACSHFRLDNSDAVRSLSGMIYSQWRLRNDIYPPNRLDSSHCFLNTSWFQKVQFQPPSFAEGRIHTQGWEVCPFLWLSSFSFFRGQKEKSEI